MYLSYHSMGAMSAIVFSSLGAAYGTGNSRGDSGVTVLVSCSSDLVQELLV